MRRLASLSLDCRYGKQQSVGRVHPVSTTFLLTGNAVCHDSYGGWRLSESPNRKRASIPNPERLGMGKECI